MNTGSLSFRALRQSCAGKVAVIIPSLLLYVSGWQPDHIVFWRFLLGFFSFMLGLVLES